MEFSGKRYWLVGASEGLGRALAQELSALGAELVLSARDRDRLAALQADLPGPSDIVTVDVRDSAAVDQAAKEAGRIDGVVYLAGVYWPTKSADWNLDQVEAMIDINLTGAARVLGRVVPVFAAEDRGHVVIIGSLSGFRGLPGAIGYGASKSGLMHLAEDIHADLHRTNVKVQLVNPGFIKSRLTDKNAFQMPFIMDAEEAAGQVVAAMRGNRFQTNFPRVFSWLFRAGNFLPESLYYRIFGAKT
jgi:short-subunit dehydrogenase